MYSPTMLRINQKKNKIRNYAWHHKASLPKQALVMDFSKSFMNYKLQSASSKNITYFTSFLPQYRRNMLMFLSSTHDKLNVINLIIIQDNFKNSKLWSVM